MKDVEYVPEKALIVALLVILGLALVIQLRVSSLFAAMLSLVVGVLFGAAIQRWGDADRATHGHKEY